MPTDLARALSTSVVVGTYCEPEPMRSACSMKLNGELINYAHYTSTRRIRGGGARVTQREWGQGDLLDTGIHHVEFARPFLDQVLEHWITK
jgi:hypothetical protein